MGSGCIDHGRKGNRDGYAYTKYLGKQERLHRLVYCQSQGLQLMEIRGLVVRHTCDNPRCINPQHLLIGSHADNMRDVAARRRHSRIKLSPEQIKYIRTHCKPGRIGGHIKNPWGYNELGRLFGVAPASIRSAYLGRTFPKEFYD